MSRYRAVLIGNACFPKDPHGLAALKGPPTDVTALNAALTDSAVGLFEPDNLCVLVNRGVQELRERLEEFFNTAGRDDVLLLYYSGHGQLDLNNRLYLCASDTRTSSLFSTALRASDINEMLGVTAATSTIIVLDCCHSGAFKNADVFRDIAAPTRTAAQLGNENETIEGRPNTPAPVSRGRYMLASSRSTQLAWDTTADGELSPFTAWLIRGLREAPAEEHLTVTGLYRQVHRWVTESCGPAPQLRFTGEGELIIARRPTQAREHIATRHDNKRAPISPARARMTLHGERPPGTQPGQPQGDQTLLREIRELLNPRAQATHAIHHFLACDVHVPRSAADTFAIARTADHGSWVCVFTNRGLLMAYQQTANPAWVGDPAMMTGADLLYALRRHEPRVGVLINPSPDRNAELTETMSLPANLVNEIAEQLVLRRK